MTTKLYGIEHFGEPLQTDILEFSLLSFFQWGLINIGAFSNVSREDEGAYGGDQSRLRPANHPGYAHGRVWEGARKDWVWESSIAYHTQPILSAGVWVDNTFFPANTTGDFAHRVNYPDGQVIFDNAIPITSVVQFPHSYRYVHVTTPDTPWWREFQMNSFRFDDSHFMQTDSKGEWDILSQHRVQLPAIVIEATPISGRIPAHIGSKAARLSQLVRFHIFSEIGDRFSSKQLLDIVTNQWHSTIKGIDKAGVIDNQVFPLSGGFLADSPKMYPQLVDEYEWKNIFFRDARGERYYRFANFHYTQATLTCEVSPI